MNHSLPQPDLRLAMSRDQARLRRLHGRVREKPGDDGLRASFEQALAASLSEHRSTVVLTCGQIKVFTILSPFVF